MFFKEERKPINSSVDEYSSSPSLRPPSPTQAKIVLTRKEEELQKCDRIVEYSDKNMLRSVAKGGKDHACMHIFERLCIRAVYISFCPRPLFVYHCASADLCVVDTPNLTLIYVFMLSARCTHELFFFLS